MSIVILGVDLGKNACSVAGVDAASAVVLRRSIRRQTLIDYVAKLPACVVAMQACCCAHNLDRIFAAQGHEIKLMSPECSATNWMMIRIAALQSTPLIPTE